MMNFIKKNLPVLMICSILLGLGNVYFTGGLTIPKYILISIVVVMVIYPVMINTRFEEILTHFKEPRPVFCSLALNFIFSPILGLAIGLLFFKNQPILLLAFMLLALIPTSSMSVAWTAFSGARVATALYLVPLNILFAAFIGLPVIFPLLMGDIITVSQVSMLKNILLIFFVPLVAGDISRRLIVRWKGPDFFEARVKPNLGAISATGILVLIFLVMSLARNRVLLQDGLLVLWITAPVLLYYLLMYGISFGWARLLIKKGRVSADKAAVIVYTSVARHINISIGITLSTFSLDESARMLLLLIIAYVIQGPSLAFFAKNYGHRLQSYGEKPV